MKTSNKLLIVLLVIVFSIPLAMIMSFKSAIRNKQYVVKNSYGYEEMSLNHLKPFKVVMLEASDGQTLTCNIKYGMGYSYKWNNYIKKKHNNIGGLISYRGDTLVISYQPKIAPDDDNYIQDADLDLVLNQEAIIISRGARVIVNTLNGGYTKPLSFDLSRNAELNITTTLDHRPDISDSLSESNRTSVSQYAITCDNSRIDIEAHIRVQKLNIAADNNSTLIIGKNVMIDSLNASIAPETMVEAPYKFIGSIKR
ncbi:hypothetical protein ACTJIJ_08290 [Niabella sp. 22666]|uniref:hypothetical protein n=1 Tax=Niabella sp. 22666 TaxID=3453954 RepID=UPI003F87701F